MAEKKPLKDEVKKLLNAILCGYQKGATIKQLNNDYETTEGCYIPHRKLGFTTVEDFLRSIPESLTISFERGELMVKAVANEHNMRILDLVSKQKTSSKKRGRGGRRGPPIRMTRNQYQGRRFHYQPPPRRLHSDRYRGNFECVDDFDDPTDRFMDNFEFSYDDTGPAPPPPTVPNFLRVKMKELFLAYKDGLSAANFELAFKRRFGSTLKYSELGFNSLYDFLMSIPDIVKLEMFPGGVFRVYGKHLSERKQPTVNRSNNKEPTLSPKSIGSTKSSQGANSDEFDDSSKVSEKWKKLIQLVLDRHPDGIWATRMASEFKVVTGKDLPYKALGFYSVIELMSSLPGIVTIERPNSKDWLLFDAKMKPSPHVTKSRNSPETRSKDPSPGPSEDQDLCTAPSIAPRFKETLRQVLLAHPKGISLGELPSQFKFLAGYEIPLERLGYASIDVLVTSVHIQDILQMVYVGEGNVLLYGIEAEREMPNFLLKTPAPEKARKEIPLDAVGPGNFYRPVPVPDNMNYMVVYVSNVNNPSNIWIQLKGEGTTDALEDLMDKLDEFYNNHQAHDYEMPESLIKVGQICVALFPEDENWHRVTITGIRDMDFVEVYYVDYGSQTCVPKSSLMMLRSKFLRLPAQAIKARLSNVQPYSKTNKTEWTADARNRLLDLVTNRALVALPTYFDKIHQVVSVCLCDTSGWEDVHINDVLCSEHLAVMMEDDISLLSAATTHEPLEVLLGSPEGKAAEAHRAEPHQPLKLHLPEESLQSAIDNITSVSKPENTSTSEEYEEPEEEYIRNIKFVELTEDYTIHIVKYDEQPHCSTGEISAMLWEKDLLRSMLRQKKVNLPRVILAKEEHPDIFQEFEEYEVKGTLEGNDLKSHVTIYKLDIVIEILELFEHPCDDLKTAIKEQIDKFNPEDPYWRGEDDEDDDDTDTNDIDLGLSELETAQEYLQLERKKILQKLRTDADNVTSYVDELDQVERKLVEVRANIKKLQDKPNNDTEHMVSVTTEADKIVQMCVEEQYKHTKIHNKPSKTVKPMPQQQTNKASSPPKKTNTVAPMPVTPKQEVKAEETPSNLSSAVSNMSLQNQGLFDQSNLSYGTNFNMQPNQLAVCSQQLPADHHQLLLQYQLLLQMSSQNQPMVPGMFQNQMQGLPIQGSGINPMMAATASHLSQQMVGGGNQQNPSNMTDTGFQFNIPNTPDMSNVSMPGFFGQQGASNLSGQVPGVFQNINPMATGIQVGGFQDVSGSFANTNFQGMMGQSQGQIPNMPNLASMYGMSHGMGRGQMGRGYNPSGGSS